MKTTKWILFVAVALMAVPSFAQYEKLREYEEQPDVMWSDVDTYSSGEYMDNPCTAEQDLVWVEYSMDVYQQGASSDSGEDRVLFDEYTNMSGAYAASGSSQSDVASWNPYSLRKYHKVNTPDDFHLVTVVTFDPAMRETTISRETACGNGMPDSAQ